MKSIIQKYCVNYIWHFTDRSNLESIKRCGGLLSYRELVSKGIAIASPGGNDWSHDADEIKGVDEYVHLCFCRSHPMLHIAQEDGRITNPIWLQIDKDVMLGPGVRFTPDVSNKAGVPVLDHGDAKAAIDFEVIYKRLDWSVPEIQQRRQLAEKSEILVPTKVPLNRIMNI